MTGFTQMATARSTYADPAGRPIRLPEGPHVPFPLGSDAVFRCGASITDRFRTGGDSMSMRRRAMRWSADRIGPVAPRRATAADGN